MRNNLVSVIIPTYNSANYVKEAVDSVLGQTYKNIGVIVVDDGSTDNTKSILEKYIKSGEIKYIYQDNNGPASARNNGIKKSSGEFIAFLDADDVWLPNKLEKQIKLFENNDVGLVYSDMEFFGGKFKYRHHSEVLKREMFRGYVYGKLIFENFIPTSSIVVRRDVLDDIGLFDEDRELFAIEDYDLWLRITRRYKVDFVNKPLVKYRIHKDKISGSRKRSYYGLCEIYKKEFLRTSFLYKPMILLRYVTSFIKYLIASIFYGNS